ncbi:MAG: patatin-like phospholipase family protein, partial [Acidobacteria bacterium]|nr:patatin-like phospholipase family protein [Acidobacteriota bacterium]
MSFRRKQDRRNIPGALTLSGRSGKSLKLPGSLNPGHEIGLAIDNLFLPYSELKSFDDLPIPFHCVATDMINAETVELKDGSLQQALRATMAIPAIFAPVEINGKVLADGGILNNIPTDLVKKMGADIVIVVNIETQIGDRSSLDSLIGVLGQTFIVASVENSRRSLREADIIIAPDLGKYSSSNYADSKAIIDLGYEGAKQKAALLRGLSLNEADWQAHLAARRAKVIPETLPTTDFLEVEGAETSKEREILRENLRETFTNKKLDKTRVEKDLTILTGTRRFDSLGYELAKKDGKNGLRIRVYDTKERSERKAVLEVGVDVNNADSDNTNFNGRGRFTVFDFGGFGSEWRNDFSIGSKTLFRSEYYRPIGESGFFVAPNAFFEDRKVGLFGAEERLAEYSFRTASVGLDIGYSINQENEIRLGYEIGDQKISRRIGSPLLPELGGTFSAASFKHQYDGADNAQIPTNGFRIKSSINYF